MLSPLPSEGAGAENLPRRVGTGSTHDAAPGMNGGAAHPEVPDGGPIPGPARRRAQKENLLQAQLPLEDVPFTQARDLLDVPGGQYLTMEDGVPEGRTVLCQGVDDGVPEGFPLGWPRRGPFPQMVGSILHEDGHYMLSRGRDRRVAEGRDHHVEVGAPGVPAVLGLIVGALQVVDAGGDGHVAAQMRSHAGAALELGDAVQRQIHFPRASSELVAPNRLDEFVLQMFGAD